MSRRALAATSFVLMIFLSQVVSAQGVPGTVGIPQQSGNTVLLGTGPTTPIVTFGAPAPTAGISNAGRAGISNFEPLPANLPGQSNTVVYYTQPGVQAVPLTQGETVPAGSVMEVVPAAVAPNEAVIV